MVMRYIKTITVLIPLQHVPTIRTQIINLSFHMTPVVSPVDATGHAAPPPTIFLEIPHILQKNNDKKNHRHKHVSRCDKYWFNRLKQNSGAFEKYRKGHYELRHVWLSTWNKSAPTGRIFTISDNCGFLENLLRKVKVLLIYDLNNV